MGGEPGTVNGRTRNETEMRGTGKERENGTGQMETDGNKTEHIKTQLDGNRKARKLERKRTGRGCERDESETGREGDGNRNGNGTGTGTGRDGAVLNRTGTRTGRTRDGKGKGTGRLAVCVLWLAVCVWWLTVCVLWLLFARFGGCGLRGWRFARLAVGVLR